jgi:DNA modification methylase
MKIIDMSISEITEYGQNPRKNDVAVQKVAMSIEKYGFQQPIVIDKNNVIVAGHTRFKAAKKLNLSSVPCVIAENLTADEIKAYRIADNKVSEYSDWDEGLLISELSFLKDADFDLTLTGFDENELFSLLKESKAIDSENDVPESSVKAYKTKQGDVWQMDEHILICGSCLDEKNYKAVLGDKKADMVFCDPPYNINFMARESAKTPLGSIQNDDMTDEEYEEFINAFLSMLRNYSDNCAALYLCSGWQKYHIIKFCVDKFFTHKRSLIWNKTNFGLGNKYRPQYEMILYMLNGKKEKIWNGGNGESDVWTISKEQINTYVHPTQKPVELVERALINSSNPDDVVLDIFGGSGTTLIACEKLKRKCRMIEVDEKFCDIIIRRWEEYSGKTAKIINSFECL